MIFYNTQQENKMRYCWIFLILLYTGIAHSEPTDFLRSDGDNAPTTMYLFTSLTCPHCQTFHHTILPKLREKYIHTHRAKIVFIDMIMNETGLMASTVLRCMPKSRSKQFETALYQSQKEWMNNPNLAPSYLLNLAQKNGLSQSDFDKCVHDVQLKKTILAQEAAYSADYGIHKMPTLVVKNADKTDILEGANPDEILPKLDEFFNS